MWLIFRVKQNLTNRTVITEFTGEETMGQAAAMFLKSAGFPPELERLDAFSFSIAAALETAKHPLNLATRVNQFPSMTIIDVTKKEDVAVGHSQGVRRSQELAHRSTGGGPRSRPG
jgi:hypothetical protein